MYVRRYTTSMTLHNRLAGMSCLPCPRPRLVQSLMTAEAQRSRFQDMSGAARRMLALGESGRFEFKRDGDAVTVGLLAALANWVAADPARDVAHLLIGVEEVEDAATGLVSGVPCDLRKGLDRTVARVQDLASRTRPIPVDAFVVEEAVAQDHPFVPRRGATNNAATLRRRGATSNPAGQIYAGLDR